MIITEFYRIREDGIVLERTYSDNNKIIQKDGTNEFYEEAIDPQGTGRTYTETDIDIPEPPEEEQTEIIEEEIEDG